MNAEAVQLKAQLEKLQEEFHCDISNLRAQCDVLEVEYCKLRDAFKTKHGQGSKKAVDESLKVQKRRHADAMSDVLCKVHMLHCKSTVLMIPRRRCAKRMGDCGKKCMIRRKEDEEMKPPQVIEELRGEIRSVHDKYKAQIARLSGEIQNLKSTHEASSKTDKFAGSFIIKPIVISRQG